MVVPIFAGYDNDINQGRIWDYDARTFNSWPHRWLGDC